MITISSRSTKHEACLIMRASSCTFARINACHSHCFLINSVHRIFRQHEFFRHFYVLCSLLDGAGRSIQSNLSTPLWSSIHSYQKVQGSIHASSKSFLSKICPFISASIKRIEEKLLYKLKKS